MQFIGLRSHIRKNNFFSVLLLVAFPLVILLCIYAFFFIIHYEEINGQIIALQETINTLPFVVVGVGAWFLIAFFSHTYMIKKSTKMVPVTRKEHPREYNLLENLCIAAGMKMPKLYIIHDDALNAFASGINDKTYAVTLTTGIINHLNDKELEGVIAHELTHIENRDVRLLIISIIFVGIFSFVVNMLVRAVFYAPRRSSNRNKKDGGGIVAFFLVLLIIATIGYFLTLLLRFSLSRKREYLADAGAVELTKDSLSMASALRKISSKPEVRVQDDDIKEMFIVKPPFKGFLSGIRNMFSTHPPIKKRIEILERGI